MKKVLALILASMMCLTTFAGCGSSDSGSTTPDAPKTETTDEKPAEDKKEEKSEEPQKTESKPTEITVITSYGGDDGNRQNYETAYKAFEQATGHKVKDASGTSNEEWKAKIMNDFETGSEPDVLFYFNGVDANKLIEGQKVVSIDEIRAEYPDFASNMDDAKMGASPVDGKNYSVPVNGYWEALFVNKKVLEDCGVAIPGPDYTWDQFMADCETIKGKGYTPVACSLQEVPHYWFEYCTFNYGNQQNHTAIPTAATDEAGQQWVNGFNDIKAMYEAGYFPTNTITATDPETFQLMADDKAAFAIDGSWKIGWFQENVGDRLEDYTVTYVPAKNERKATDLIGGLSMGYYITKKAWDDPEKRDACVQFISAMTTDDVVSTFGATAVTALKNGTQAPSDADIMVQTAIEMTKNATSVTPAAQDGLNQNARNALFADVKNIVTGKTTPEAAIDSCLTVK